MTHDDAFESIRKQMATLTEGELNLAIQKLDDAITTFQRLAYRWQPIDYSQLESGQAPFDGEPIISMRDCDGRLNFMRFEQRSGIFLISLHDEHYGEEQYSPTHWRPVPEFMKG